VEHSETPRDFQALFDVEMSKSQDCYVARVKKLLRSTLEEFDAWLGLAECGTSVALRQRISEPLERHAVPLLAAL
jgi:hypothetical protein